MGRKEELHVNVPSFFRCPISLDVMKSPVSLCTGVTYDRSSIQRWLAAGNNTCPATMQVLPTTDLVPNHTLHRLIQIWSHPPTTTSQIHNPHDLLLHLSSSTDPLPSLRTLASLAKDQDGVDQLLKIDGCVAALNGVIVGAGRRNNLEAMDLAVGVLVLVLDKSKDDNNKIIKPLASSPHTISSVLALIKSEKTSSESRTNAVNFLRKISSVDTETKLVIAGTDGILQELAKLLVDRDQSTEVLDSCLSCLTCLSSPRRVRSQIVRLGIVTSLGKLLFHRSIPSATAEKALKLLETASTCTEGRAAICEEAGVVVTAVVGRMMKVSPAATEHAVVVLWSVCHLFRDRRAQEAVAVAGSNGLTKILLLMQSNCSLAARQMAGDLLRIFRVNSKSCLASYDTKATHIMPF